MSKVKRDARLCDMNDTNRLLMIQMLQNPLYVLAIDAEDAVRNIRLSNPTSASIRPTINIY